LKQKYFSYFGDARYLFILDRHASEFIFYGFQMIFNPGTSLVAHLWKLICETQIEIETETVNANGNGKPSLLN